MKKFFDKYQYIIGTTIIFLLLIKDVLGASIYTFEVTDKWIPFELTIGLYLTGIALLLRHIITKRRK
ncbi:MAG: hypothetical protein P8M03_04705 [Flavobacteriaceae bacterium]|nr:hypothetical protein [Flavobacteriaceae bacterium]